MTFGEKIKKARTAKKLTQKQLAERINAKHNSICDFGKDKIGKNAVFMRIPTIYELSS